MICQKCGKDNTEGSTFCAQCGSSLTPTPMSAGFDPRSGAGDSSVIPPEIHGWNWGAAFLNWIWGLFNGVYIALLMFVPFVNIFFWIILGIKGNEWAWRNKKWASVEAFKATQRKWNIAGIIVFVLSVAVFPIMIIVMMSTLAVVSLDSARGAARDARRISDIKQIQTALELFYVDNGSYPVDDAMLGDVSNNQLTDKGFVSSSSASSMVYMGVVPSDFSDAGTDGGYRYYSIDGKTYTILFSLEDEVAGLQGSLKATPRGICSIADPNC